MITEITMYWLTRLDGIVHACGIIAFCSCALSIFLWIGSIASKEDGHEWRGLRLGAWGVTVLFIFSVLGVLFIPTSKEMAAIYAIPAISRSEAVQKDIPEIYDAGMEYIKAKLKAEAANGTN